MQVDYKEPRVWYTMREQGVLSVRWVLRDSPLGEVLYARWQTMRRRA